MSQNSFCRSRLWCLVCTLCLLLPVSPSIANTASSDTGHPEYDLVINQGEVYNPETRSISVLNIGIRDGKIQTLSQTPLAGRRVIDAKGYVVGPGFIDLHAHGGTLLSGRLQAFDGITTAIEAEVGQLPISAVYQRAATEGRASNYGWTASWAMARAQVMGQHQPDGSDHSMAIGLSNPAWAAPSNPTQRAQILSILEENLLAGAMGIGLPLGYASSVGHGEIRAISELAAEHDVPIFVHTRFWGGDDPAGDIAAVQEIVSNAITTGAHWFMHHVSLASVAEISEMVVAARSAGARISVEALVSETGSTFLGAEFLSPERLPTFSRGLKPTDILYYGKPIQDDEELRALRAQDPTALIFLLHRDSVANLEHRATQRQSFVIPDVILGSDGMPWKNRDGSQTDGASWPIPTSAWAHPRSNATFTRFIELWVNQWQEFTLMDTFVMGSYQAAKSLQDQIPAFAKKGRIAHGADADLIIFKPDQIKVHANLQNPRPHSTGMHWVLINGEILVDEGELLEKAKPGQPILRAIQ